MRTRSRRRLDVALLCGGGVLLGVGAAIGAFIGNPEHIQEMWAGASFHQDGSAAIEVLLPAGTAAPSVGARIRAEGRIGTWTKAGKLGAILLQYPDWFVISHQNKDAILHARERLPDDRLAVEFRNETWMSERNRAETLKFLTDHDLTYVSVDEPQGFPSSVPPVTGSHSTRIF